MDTNRLIDAFPDADTGAPRGQRSQVRRRWASLLSAALVLFGISAVGSTAVPAAGAATATTPGGPLADWTEVQPATSPPALDGAASAYDPATGQLVVFGGETNGTASAATWVWNGSTWDEAASSGPPAVTGATMAFDDATNQLVLYGGSGSAGDSDGTWSWNGTSWSGVGTESISPALSNASLAYDPLTQTLVLFGGRSGSTDQGVTYLFVQGTGWAEYYPQDGDSTPPARADASMAFDPALGEIVLYGGDNGSADLSDTWALNQPTDGVYQWTQLSPPTSPPALSSASVAYDPSTGQLLVFGGESATGPVDETWAFNGTTWTEQGPKDRPTARLAATMAFDEATNQLVLYGGNADGESLSDTWTFGYPQGSVPSTWTELDPGTSPPARQDASMAYDPSSGQLVLFGGEDADGDCSGDTWTWNGNNWTQQSPAESPSPRCDSVMAYDPAIGEIVLFGGFQGLGDKLADTWTWDGSNWTELDPGTSPPARYESTMAYDPALGELVLFSGAGASDDTWAFQTYVTQNPSAGAVSDWTKLSTPSSSTPPARFGGSMVYDPATGYPTLFGGFDSQGNLDDTWEFAGSAWDEVTPGTSPSARYESAMDYDPAIGLVVLFGGDNDSSLLGDTWTWNGAGWTQQAPTASPPARTGASMAYDEGTGQLVLFGGSTDSGEQGDTWVYGTPDLAPQISSAASTTFDTGQAGSFTVTATGNPAPTFTLGSDAPSWMELDAGTGLLTGTPPAGTEGKISFKIEASNGIGTAATQAFTLKVDAPPAITSAASATFADGVSDSFGFTASGYPAPTFKETGALPAGVSFTKAGLLWGTPEAGASGTYPLTVKASNDVAPVAVQHFTLTVTAPPAITSKDAATFHTEETGTFVVTTSGTPTPAITETGTLPKGVTFTDSGDGNGVLTGLPAFNSAGSYPITFTASNANGTTTQSFTLTVSES